MLLIFYSLYPLVATAILKETNSKALKEKGVDSRLEKQQAVEG